VSSIGGVVAFANLSMYHASKWALEGFTQSLATEVFAFGVKVTLIEPGGFTTDWRDSSAIRSDPNPAYDGLRKAQQEMWSMSRRGDPINTSDALFAIVDSDNPPLRVFFGDAGLWLVRAEYERRIATWEEWDEVARSCSPE
jgi:NAD(P)-dependent dehydrogenase (short-subunit alcohol dehydrogenase family)